MKVFWVEDSSDIVAMVRMIVDLNALDVEFEVVTDVTTARSRLADRLSVDRPDVVLLDMRLPDGTGLEVFAAHQDRLRDEHVPALVLTSSNDLPDQAASTDLGLPLVTKPLHIDQWVDLFGNLTTIATTGDQAVSASTTASKASSA